MNCNPLPASTARWIVLAGLAAGGAPAASTLPPLVNHYELQFPIARPDVTLTSAVECGILRCDIAYRIASIPIEGFVKVAWKDKNGNALVTASSANFGPFWLGEVFDPNVVQAVQFKKNENLGGRRVNPVAQSGTADFTGTANGPGIKPCGAGLICNDAEYYEFLPSAFGGTSTPGGRSSAPNLVATSAVELHSITGTQSNVGFDPADPSLLSPVAEVPFVTFNSAVFDDNGSFRYRYSATNHTGLSIPFDWSATGLSGVLPAFGTAERETLSSGTPLIQHSVPSWTLQSDGTFPVREDFAASLDFLTPVPEPSIAWLLAAGLGCLALRRRRVHG